jgi:hypothetical protein
MILMGEKAMGRRQPMSIAIASVIVAALAGCAEHAPPDLSQVPYRSDPPTIQSDTIGGPPLVMAHPYPCWRCGWTWW